MPTLTAHQPTIRRRKGGQPGNTNNKRDNSRTELLSIRCRPSDKAAWVKASTKARAAGHLDETGFVSLLAAWATTQLNRTADAQLGARAAQQRIKGTLTLTATAAR